MFFKLEQLEAETQEEKILKGVDLEIEKATVQALLGPNGSGKSTLAQVIAGNPQYSISRGEIIFKDNRLNNLSPEERVKKGIVLAWQNPPSIKGIKLSQLLERISNKKVDSKELNISPSLLERELNVGFSGGEKKLSELAQVLALNPSFVIFDEIDSGLDLRRISEISQLIKDKIINKGISVLFITHSGRILRFLKPDLTNVMVKGEIVCQQKDYERILSTVKNYGYEKCKKACSQKGK